jgi:hypothetical protein
MADERAFGLGCPWSKSKGPAAGAMVAAERQRQKAPAGDGPRLRPDGGRLTSQATVGLVQAGAPASLYAHDSGRQSTKFELVINLTAAPPYPDWPWSFRTR